MRTSSSFLFSSWGLEELLSVKLVPFIVFLKIWLEFIVFFAAPFGENDGGSWKVLLTNEFSPSNFGIAALPRLDWFLLSLYYIALPELAIFFIYPTILRYRSYYFFIFSSTTKLMILQLSLFALNFFKKSSALIINTFALLLIHFTLTVYFLEAPSLSCVTSSSPKIWPLPMRVTRKVSIWSRLFGFLVLMMHLAATV